MPLTSAWRAHAYEKLIILSHADDKRVGFENDNTETFGSFPVQLTPVANVQRLDDISRCSF